MKIYCLYGVGLPTERSYHYAFSDDEPDSAHGSTCANGNDPSCLTHQGASPYSADTEPRAEKNGTDGKKIVVPRLMVRQANEASFTCKTNRFSSLHIVHWQLYQRWYSL